VWICRLWSLFLMDGCYQVVRGVRKAAIPPPSELRIRRGITVDHNKTNRDATETRRFCKFVGNDSAMIRPSPGLMFSVDRYHWLKPLGDIFFANSDLTGFSIFEEAQYRVVEAARRALQRL
jgi:hypothetical protein